MTSRDSGARHGAVYKMLERKCKELRCTIWACAILAGKSMRTPGDAPAMWRETVGSRRRADWIEALMFVVPVVLVAWWGAGGPAWAIMPLAGLGVAAIIWLVVRDRRAAHGK